MSLLRRLMNRNMSLCAQLDALAECGIVLRDGIGPEELLSRHSDRDYETTPFKMLLATLGADSEEPPYLPLSNNVWLMHADCAAHTGDYVKLAHHMATIAGNALPLESVRDEFDFSRGVAWLLFNLHGQEFRWPAKIEERWIDPMTLSRFAALLEAQSTDQRYICLDLGGQDCLLGCATEAQFATLRKRTGLAFEWLG